MRLKHRKQCWQVTGVGGQEGENKEEEEDCEGRGEEVGSKKMKARIIAWFCFGGEGEIMCRIR